MIWDNQKKLKLSKYKIKILSTEFKIIIRANRISFRMVVNRIKNIKTWEIDLVQKKRVH